MKYFKEFPLTQYWFDSGEDLFLAKNVFIKLKILEHLEETPTLMQKYILNDVDRPDIIAHNLYGNSNLHWTILLANNIMDPDDWVMSHPDLDTYVKTKYDNHYEVEYSVRNNEIASLESHQILINQQPFGTVDSDPDASFTDPGTFQDVTHYDSEVARNDSKREIRVIRPDRMAKFLQDVENKLRLTNG